MHSSCLLKSCTPCQVLMYEIPPQTLGITILNTSCLTSWSGTQLAKVLPHFEYWQDEYRLAQSQHESNNAGVGKGQRTNDHGWIMMTKGTVRAVKLAVVAGFIKWVQICIWVRYQYVSIGVLSYLCTLVPIRLCVLLLRHLGILMSLKGRPADGHQNINQWLWKDRSPPCWLLSLFLSLLNYY